MSDALARLEPGSVWGFFSTLSTIPRPSKHEEKVVRWVRSLAEEHGWTIQSDSVGNLVCRVPASPGREGAPVVVLQAHLDMVCEKNKGTEHDFMSDPIVPRIDGDWVYATGTTLGADNGIGVAAALAAATDDSVQHGPLELLFTLDEETGLTGAQGLDGSLLEGRILINMDSEEDGVLFVGCAGGADCHLFMDPERREPTAGFEARRLVVRGLRGGHSGLNIHENRGNALKLLARTLIAAAESGVSFELGDLEGGSKHNAIPREAEATLYLSPGDGEKMQGVLSCMREAFAVELDGVDGGMEIALESGVGSGKVFGDRDRDRLLHLLAVLPHGVLAMSGDIEGLVETSSNLAVVEATNGRVQITTSSRSSVNSSLTHVLTSIRSAAALAGWQVETFDGYPGWKPNMSSAALATVRKVYADIWGEDPEVTAVHAGLECGLLGEKVPGMDMISFGPQIEGAHSPDERVQVSSVARFWDALRRVLDDLSKS